MTPGLANKHLAGLTLSSMWTEGLAEGQPREVRDWLLHLSRATTVYRDFQNGVRRMVGQTDQGLENMVVRFSPKDIVQIGADLQKRMLVKADVGEGGLYVLRRPPSYEPTGEHVALVQNEANENIQNELGDLILTFTTSAAISSFRLDAEALQPRYVLPLPADICPTVIQAEGRELLLGLDFSLGENCLIFTEQPLTLFPDRTFLIRGGEYTTTAPLSFTWQVDGLKTDGRYLTRYLRESQSFNDFRLALLEVGGVRIMPQAGILQSVKAGSGVTRYVFADFVVAVDYPHTPLVIGQSYEQGFVIGDSIQVFGPTGGTWWRALDWSQGLSLDNLCPFPGLTVPDQPTKFYGVSGTGAHIHCRFDLAGPAEIQDKFWEHIRQAEVATNNYLNAVVGIPSVYPEDAVFKNPLDLIFQYLLGSRAIVVRMNEDTLGIRAKRVKAFIQRERPVGSVVTITDQPLAQI